jgi:hypothetical protein
MLFFLVPRRYRSAAMLALGAVWLVVGLVISSRILLVLGGVLIVAGAYIGIRRFRSARADDLDRSPGR